jgi:uncharacterized protein YciW
MTSEGIPGLAGLQPGQAVAGALALRADVLEMTEATEAAVLRPKDPGGFSHAVRAALALRIARLSACQSLADMYERALRREQAVEATLALADPAFDGGENKKRRAILAFADRVTSSPKDATAADIERLRNAGLAEADIVRLAQLNAFLAFKIRLVEGLKLMAETE